MEGLEPIHSWLQECESSTDAFKPVEIPEWGFDVDSWNVAPPDVEIEESNPFPFDPASEGIFDHGQLPMWHAASGVRDDIGQPPIYPDFVDPSLLQLFGPVDGIEGPHPSFEELDQPQLFRSGASDCFPTPPSEEALLSNAGEIPSFQHFSSELTRIQSKVSKYV